MDSMLTQSILKDRGITYLITDRHLKIIEFNDAAGIFNSNDYSPILGTTLYELVPELIGSEAVLTDILVGKLPRFELAWVNVDRGKSQTNYLNLVNLPHQDKKGQITGLIHLMQDVTDVGEIQQQLAQHRNELRLLQAQLTRRNQELATANAELQRLSDMKSTFVSVAAHELNSPLTSITGYLELLLDEVYGPLTDSQRDSLHIMGQSSNRLVVIIKNLLDVTRIEAERVELLLRPTDLVALVETIAAELKPQLQVKKQRLSVQAQSDLPFALCDVNRTAQIMGNLVSNAVKYTFEGGLITISLALAEEEGFIQMSVADNGVGISAKDQAGLFKRFFRAENASLTGASGTGLGLYITRSLVELQGGRIWFESELNKGSTFNVTFSTAGVPIIA